MVPQQVFPLVAQNGLDEVCTDRILARTACTLPQQVPPLGAQDADFPVPQQAWPLPQEDITAACRRLRCTERRRTGRELLAGDATRCIPQSFSLCSAEGPPVEGAGSASVGTPHGVRSILRPRPPSAECAKNTAGQCARKQLQSLPPRRLPSQDASCFVYKTRCFIRCLRHHPPSTLLRFTCIRLYSQCVCSAMPLLS